MLQDSTTYINNNDYFFSFWLVLSYEIHWCWQPLIQVWQLLDSLNQSQFFAKHSNQSVCFILCRQYITWKCYFRVSQSGHIWNKMLFCPYILILYYINQIDSMLPCICSVKDHRTSKCGKNISGTQGGCSYHILTSSVI